MKIQHSDLFPIAFDSVRHVSRQIANGEKAMAEYIGEYRPPRKGEWFLSGAKVEAYYAYNDISECRHIAKPIVVEHVTRTRKVRDIK
jgi:hypothetical protein